MNDPQNPLASISNMIQSAMAGMPAEGKGEWWQSLRYPDTPNFSTDNLMNCARSALFGQALAGGETVREVKKTTFNTVEYNEAATRLKAYVKKELDGRLIYSLETTKDRDIIELFFVFSGGAIFAECLQQGTIQQGTSLTITVVGTTQAHMQLNKDMSDTCKKSHV